MLLLAALNMPRRTRKRSTGLVFRSSYFLLHVFINVTIGWVLKLSVYLDITESHISKQISTKANTFFNAIHSQDEVQEHVLKTCTAVKQLRANLRLLDESVIMRSIRVIKLVNKRLRLLALIDKLERMSSVYETQPAIQVHLNSSEFTGALDLIAMSQVILRQELRGIRALRHYDSQFSEMESLIDKILHQEFAKYIISDLSRDFLLGSGVLNSVSFLF